MRRQLNGKTEASPATYQAGDEIERRYMKSVENLAPQNSNRLTINRLNDQYIPENAFNVFTIKEIQIKTALVVLTPLSECHPP